MGKTTDEFIKKIDAQKDKCADCMELSRHHIFAQLNFRKELETYAYIMKRSYDWAAKMAATTNQKLDEQKVFAEPEYKKAQAAYAATEAKIADSTAKRLAVLSQMKPVLQTMKSLTDQFDAYVKKKEKAWVGSKNSVPAAKAAIAGTREYIADCLPIANQ
jgi:hypothetical protein